MSAFVNSAFPRSLSATFQLVLTIFVLTSSSYIVSLGIGPIHLTLVVEGRNLASKDANGLSDPFLLFGPIDKKGNWAFVEKRSKPLKSKTSRKTLSPVWRQNFEIPIDTSAKALRVEVWDWDLIGSNEFMGQAIIALADLPRGLQTEQWFPLEARSGKKDVVSGDVFVRILYVQEQSSLNLGGVMQHSLVKRVAAEAAPSSILIPTASSTPPPIVAPAMSEEEYAAMDDMRSGEIDLIIPALFKYSASIASLQIGLPAFAKWATTASVAERIAFLDKYQGSIFSLLLESASQNKNDGVVVFYSLHTFGPFMRLFEAKQYWTPAMAALLAESLQSPPTALSVEDRARHCCNCLITLANACTSNQSSNKDSKVPKDTAQQAAERCESIVLTSGALDVTLTLLSNAAPTDPRTKHILALLIKVSHSQAIKSALQQSSLLKSISNILSTFDDPMILWLAIDALGKYATPIAPTEEKYTTDVLKMAGLWDSLTKILSRGATGLHGSSIETSIVYLISILSPLFKDSIPFSTKADSPFLKLIMESAPSNYLTNIPKPERKSLLPERCLKLMVTIGTIDPESRKLIASKFASIAKWIVDFAHFASVLSEATNTIKALIQWSVLSKEEASSQLQQSLANLEHSSHVSKHVNAFIGQL